MNKIKEANAVGGGGTCAAAAATASYADADVHRILYEG